ncbi:Rieske 2Fe-2S domain-containing protein [Pseudomonas sp. NPDC096950]|uniref:aromatic ring-hydroxylating dioxygenase subunit alpha n=1 Tax=Pseudomonas sp. NPDC096950 TaxID=3364485 RepID=UPI00383A3549
MLVKNCWYVVAWDNEIPADGFLARTVCEVPLALWRDGAGRVVAFEDRCCHRAAKLSMGRKEGDCVRCMYHGLVFDKAGECVAAPAQEKLPPNARIRTFPIVESYRWVWIWMGDPALADPSQIPDMPLMADPQWRYLDGYIHYDANYLLITDNLLDFSHLPFLHPTTLGGSPGYASVLPTVERKERSLLLTKWVLDTDPPAYSAKFGGYPEEASVDRWMVYEFSVPGILVMDAGMMLAGTGAKEGVRENAVEFRGFQALTPESEGSTHYFFAHAHNFLIDQPQVTEAIHKGVIAAFEEDRDMIMGQQENLQLDPDFKMVPLSVDSALGQFRWLINKFLKLEAAQ